MNFFKKRSTAWAIFAITVVFAIFAGQQGKQVTQTEILPSGVYVQDKADLLSDATEKHITQMNNGLVSAISAEIQVAVIDTTDGKDIFDMAYDLAIETNLSPNCCVFLVAVDDIDAVIIQGDEIMYSFPDDFLTEILQSNFTVSDFENRDVDFAVRATFDQLIERYEDYYNITVKASNTIQRRPRDNSNDQTARIIGLIIFILIIILVCYIVTRPRRRTVFVPTSTPRTYGRTNNYPPSGSYTTPPPYSGGSSSRSGGFGSSSSKRGGSFSSSSSRSSRSGGFTSSSRSSGGSFSSRSSGSSRSGGFSSGSRGGSFGGSRGGGFRK